MYKFIITSIITILLFSHMNLAHTVNASDNNVPIAVEDTWEEDIRENDWNR